MGDVELEVNFLNVEKNPFDDCLLVTWGDGDTGEETVTAFESWKGEKLDWEVEFSEEV